MRRLLCDVDGVLLDFVGGLCRELSERGFEYKPEDFRHWDLQAALSADAQCAMAEIMAEPGFCRGLEWYEGAREFFDRLQEKREVFVVTAPFDGSETWERERKIALDPFPRRRVLSISGESKHVVRGDILIEDHPGTCRNWLYANPGGVALLVDRPWNSREAKEWVRHTRMWRVVSYAAALKAIEDLEDFGT